MTKKTARALALMALIPSLACAAPGIEEVLTPAQYFDCQVAARQATIRGVQDRAVQLNKVGVTEAQKRSDSDLARDRVTVAMYACGKQTASTLGAYAHRNAEQLQTWLNANPQMNAKLDALSQQVNSLSTQMSAASPSPKP